MKKIKNRLTGVDCEPVGAKTIYVDPDAGLEPFLLRCH